MDKNYFMYLCNKKGFKLSQIASELAIKKDTLYKKLVGKIEFSIKEVLILMQLFNMTFEDLMITNSERGTKTMMQEEMYLFAQSKVVEINDKIKQLENFVDKESEADIAEIKRLLKKIFDKHEF